MVDSVATDMETVLNLDTSRAQNNTVSTHILGDEWTMWAHLPHDTDWSVSSYKRIHDFNSVEQSIALTETLPHKMIRNCMLFVMRKGISPTWEDKRNRDGGCFSYKVSNKIVPAIWRDLTYTMIGETLGTTESYQKSINGITISPKKNFCVVKVWMTDCKSQDPNIIKSIGTSIVPQGCLFKKHNPEY
jgi:hypothetical protein